MSQYRIKIIVIAILLLILLVGLLSWFNNMSERISQKLNKAKSVSSFEQCIQAGYPVQESYPRKCSVPKGKTFSESTEPPIATPMLDNTTNSGQSGGVCVNKCGDGKCAEVVCQAVGCPCSETAQSCPQDCH
jgi:hypothetical protein